MKARPHDASRLDVPRFALEGAQIGGQWPLASLDRLASTLVEVPAGAMVTWRAQGLRDAPPAGLRDEALHVHANTRVRLQCQRCLETLDLRLEVDRVIRFADSEAAAEALDAEIDDDVLALSSALDLRSLLEDELLLALPLVPRHAHCDVPAAGPGMATVEDEPPAANPFAPLAALKGRPPTR